MAGLERSLSIFWSESAIYVALYAIFALLVCGLLVLAEFHYQTGEVAVSRVTIKAVLLLIASIMFFSLALYLSSWHSSLLGGEVLATIVVALAWLVSSYFLNAYLLRWTGLTLENTTLYLWAPILVLISPFVVFTLFIGFLGRRWSI